MEIGKILSQTLSMQLLISIELPVSDEDRGCTLTFADLLSVSFGQKVSVLKSNVLTVTSILPICLELGILFTSYFLRDEE